MAHFMAIEVTDGGLLLPLSNKFIQPLERCLVAVGPWFVMTQLFPGTAVNDHWGCTVGQILSCSMQTAPEGCYGCICCSPGGVTVCFHTGGFIKSSLTMPWKCPIC